MADWGAPFDNVWYITPCDSDAQTVVFSLGVSMEDCFLYSNRMGVDIYLTSGAEKAKLFKGACAVINTWYENEHVNIYSATVCGQPTTLEELCMQVKYT